MSDLKSETTRGGPRAMSGPQTILFIDHTAKMGGGEIALLNLVTHLDHTRYRPIVMLFEDGPLVERLKAKAIEVVVVPLDRAVMETRKDSLDAGGWLKVRRLGTSAIHALGVARRIRQLRPALVHTNSLKADLIGGLAARLVSVPVIWHVRDRIAEDYLPRRAVKIFRSLAKWLPAHVVANSAATLETLMATDQTRAHYSVIHNGTVIHDGVEQTEPKQRGQPNRRPIVGLIGRISPWKGQDVLIRAAALLKERDVNCEFRLIGAALFGEAAFEESLRTLASDLGVEDQIVFSGFKSDVAVEITQLDLVVHASTVPEPFGQVIIEGMVAQKPVIATRAGGVVEIVDDGETGLLVTPGDVRELADAIDALLKDPERATGMGLRGREAVLRRFTIDRVARDVQELYDQLLATPRLR